MQAIDILQRCRDATGDIRRLAQRIQRRRDALTSISAPLPDPNGGSHEQNDPDKISRVEAEIDALERKKRAREDAQRAEVAAACVLLDSLPELEGSVLHGFYIKQESTAGIAKRLRYQDSYIRKVKISAEKALKEIPPEQVAAALPPWYLREYGGEA